MLHADDDSMVNQSLAWEGYDNRTPIEESDDFIPCFFSLEGLYDYIGQSSFTTPEDAGEKISYQQADATLAYTKFLAAGEGASFGFGYTNTLVNWKQNPFFKERYFNNLTLGVNGFTKRFCNWDWRGGVSVNLDANELIDNSYNLYNLTLWGRYNFCNYYLPDMGIHLGFIGRTGIDQDKLLPILGVDFKMSHCWKLNLVYPVNISAIYSLTESWSFALSGKIWNSRHRVGKNEALSRGIFEYRNAGAEISLNYDCGNLVTANIHVGSTLGGGDLKIADSQNHVIRHNKFRAAGYIGSGFSFKF